MARCLPPSAFKATRYGPRVRDLPGEGTKLRAAYDHFLSHKGKAVSENISYRTREDLENYYGLDIRRVGFGKWMLCGEWFGKVYIDYLAEHLSKEGIEA